MTVSKKIREMTAVIADALQEAGYDARQDTSPREDCIDVGGGKLASFRIEDGGRVVIVNESETDFVEKMFKRAKVASYFEKRSKTWRVYTLDVWGNEDDGFEVNDRSRAGTVVIPTDATDEDIVRLLRANAFLDPRVKASDIDIDGDDYSMTVDDAKTGQPIFQLEAN
jgi:hypothetical protein